MIVLELVEELLRHQVLALQRADELQQVLVRDHVGRGCRQLAEQMVDHRVLQPVALYGQVDHPVGRVRQHLGGSRAGEALEVDGALEERVDRGGHEQVEVGDRRQVPQRLWGLEVRVLEYATQPHVGLFTPATRGEKNAHHVVQRVRVRQLRGADVEPGGEPFGGPVVQQPRSAIGGDHQQLGSDDRDDPPLLDEAQQILPRVVVERRRKDRGGTAHGAAGPQELLWAASLP